MNLGFPLTPPLDHAWIPAHIPHSGSMCLLDEVAEWDAERKHQRPGIWVDHER